MATRSKRTRSARRRNRRYIGTLVLFVVLAVGWSWLWYYAAGQAEIAIDGWRAREAKSGRVYTCGAQTVGGYPFRIEVNCDKAAALFRSNQPPLEIKAGGMLIAAQIYQPNLLITEFHGPLTIADPGKSPNIVVNWKLAQSSVRGTPAAPAPELHPAAAQPVDADITAELRGLNDFAPKPWPVRFRELQAADGRIDITQARVQQGETIAVGNGSLSLNANGRLQGQLRVTVAAIEPFLATVGAQQMVQASPNMDKLVGALDRLAPGLGNVARQQATSSNLSLGINLLGEQTTLEGKRAVTLPLRIDDGSMFLGPIKIGTAPALF